MAELRVSSSLLLQFPNTDFKLSGKSHRMFPYIDLFSLCCALGYELSVLP